MSGDPAAIEAAEQDISETFQPYIDDDCRAGFVLITSRAPSIPEGLALSSAVSELLGSTVPEVFAETGTEGISAPGTAPSGEVILQLFLNAGCSLLDTGGE